MNKLTKQVVKLSLGFAVSALIGYTIKLEQKIEDRVDEHFEK